MRTGKNERTEKKRRWETIESLTTGGFKYVRASSLWDRHGATLLVLTTHAFEFTCPKIKGVCLSYCVTTD